MIEGIGIDLLEIQRIKELLSRQINFPKRILTKGEYVYFEKMSAHRQIEFLAGRFAAKEAFSKAFGSGIGKELSFLDIEILPNAKNKPVLHTAVYSGDIHVTISHSANHVVAQVILESRAD